MSQIEDYYKILQVHYDASKEVINAAYRRLSTIYHPDVNKSADALELMKKINAAYETLKDDIKRGEYHEMWLESFNGINEHAVSSTEPEELIKGFFNDLLDERWEDAYNKLTESDKGKISLSDFYEWKTYVSKVYKMGSYMAKKFKHYKNCVISEINYEDVYEYYVFVTDMDLRTKRMNEEAFSKYAVYENGQWRVCLGYNDIKPLILKFKYLFENISEINPDRAYAEAVLQTDGITGALSRSAFIKLMESEAVRCRRYKCNFSVAIINISGENDADIIAESENSNLYIAAAAKALKENIRETDVLCRWSTNTLAVMFTETYGKSAFHAFNKLIIVCGSIADVKLKAHGGIADFNGGSVEETIMSAFSQVGTLRDNEEKLSSAAPTDSQY